MSDHAAIFRRRIDAHFARRGTPLDEQELSDHLVGCASCRDRYARHQIFAELDPTAPKQQERIAHAIGLKSRTHRAIPLVFAVAGATALGVVAWQGVRPQVTEPDFIARSPATARPPDLKIYRIANRGTPEPVGHEIRASDELAFAYANRAGFPFLMVFAIDEHGHVYWYHPAWFDETDDPKAVSIEPSTWLHELPEAVAHAFDGNELHIFGLFSRSPLSTKAVEAALAHAPGRKAGELLASGVLGNGTLSVEHELRVVR